MSSESENNEHDRLLQAVASMQNDKTYQEVNDRVYPKDDARYWTEEYTDEKHKRFLEELLDVYLKQFGYSGKSDPKLSGSESIFIAKLYASPAGLGCLFEFIISSSRSISPQHQLRFVNEVLKLVKEDSDVAGIGAGALEYLFRNHCDEIYDGLDQMIRSNPNMRKAVQAVWCHSEPKLFSKLKALLDRYGLKSG